MAISECPLCGRDPPPWRPAGTKDLFVAGGDGELAVRVAGVLRADHYHCEPLASPQERLDAAGIAMVVEDHGWHWFVRPRTITVCMSCRAVDGCKPGCKRAPGTAAFDKSVDRLMLLLEHNSVAERLALASTVEPEPGWFERRMAKSFTGMAAASCRAD